MAQFIIHPQDSGEIAVVIPAPNCGLSIEEIARKDVPAGVPFLIVNDTDLPDWSYSAAWEADFSQPHGHGIGADEWFAQKAAERMAAIQTVAEQENLQFDAIQRMIAEQKARENADGQHDEGEGNPPGETPGNADSEVGSTRH